MTTAKVWAIKLGSAGRCVPFCERHGIVGIGWASVDMAVLAARDRGALRRHVAPWYANDNRALGSAVGQIWRLAHDCKVGDYVVYYDPPRKRVQIGRFTSEIKKRTFAPEDPTDVWLYREVELAKAPIPIVDFYGGLRGSLLGPRMSLWELDDPRGAVAQLFEKGEIRVVDDPELTRAYDALKALVAKRAETLTPEDWEWVVADYFIAQGARVDERRVGGSRAVIDVEARFDRGELGEELWRVQVKHLHHAVDWPMIRAVHEHRGACDRFAFVSVAGFTEEARAQAYDEEIVLLEGSDFTRFLLSGKLRERLRERLHLPFGPVL